MDAFQEILQSYREGSTVNATEFLLLISLEMVVAILIYWHFRRYGESASSQDNFAGILPVVSITTFLVISVIKTSLALSLGLVGALSIVRFRTPIKDAEELVYIFLAIAVGIGMAAGQVMVTVVSSALVMFVIAIIKRSRERVHRGNTYLSVDIGGDMDTESVVERICGILSASTRYFFLQRCETRDGTLHLSFTARMNDPGAIASVTDQINSAFETIGVCFIDESTTPTP